ncbi:sensor histidine kinase [Stigmatella hybrida]|uniref:sensor histidine kinase n=1 Tax=Stigmatella hybrida TaxID=394097 RepID=UPI0021E18B8C|nr:ATP-binding protein [Stigmatella hybrida]
MRRLVWLAMGLVDAAEGVWGRLIDGRRVIVESLWREGKAIEPRHVVFAPNEGVPGHVMVTREPYISNDAAQDAHVLSHLQQSRGFYNLIDLPLFARSGELLGCFELHNKKDHQSFTEEDLELLKALRSLAGVALENAHLAGTVQFERRTLEMIVQQMPAGFTLAEAPSGRILYSNAEADRLLGHPALLLKSEAYAPWAAVHPDLTPYRPEEYPLARALHEGKTLQDEEVLLRRGDGTLVYLSVMAAPIRDAEGRISEAVSVFIDTSGRKQAERQLEESLASEQMARQEAEAALAQLRVERALREQVVLALSHDLRTPLTAAKMSAQLIPRQPDLPDKIYSLAARVRHNIDRADQMITDLLDVNRIRAGQGLPIERAPVELRQVVAGALEELSTLHGERFLLRGEERVQGTWDARALRRAVENLCGNAIKYGDPAEQVTVSLKQEGGRVELAVHNWGMPISPEEQAHLFQSFHRTKSAEASGKKGWGIGLTLVRGVAEAHGGSVSVESTEEAGTTFRMRLPTMPPG